MSFKDCPDCFVPRSEERCEAMTKPHNHWPDWSQESHRCVRIATQGRAGYMVCAVHASVKSVTYWDRKTPDKFRGRYE